MLAQYKHDCTNCKFLGSITYKGPTSGEQTYDLYVCIAHKETTIVARSSDDGPDYASALVEHITRITKGIIDSGGSYSTAGPALLAGYAMWRLSTHEKG